MRKIFYRNSLIFEIYIIGYKSQGESIVFFLKADETAVIAGLVDCYELESVNIAVDLLQLAGRKHFDFVCWTHPHEDHSIGMADILENYCDKDTNFWMAPIVNNDIEKYSKASQEIYGRLFEVIESRKRKKMHVRTVSNENILMKCSCQELLGTDNKDYPFYIYSFAPDSELLLKNLVRDVEQIDNLYSIGLIIQIGTYCVMLAGDVENQTINNIPADFLEYPVNYVKIPHHASQSGADLVNRMAEVSEVIPNVVVTTVFRRYNLPQFEVLKKYYNWNKQMEIYSTGDIFEEQKVGELYGLIKTSFDILEQRQYLIETELFGNAVPVIHM